MGDASSRTRRARARSRGRSRARPGPVWRWRSNTAIFARSRAGSATATPSTAVSSSSSDAVMIWSRDEPDHPRPAARQGTASESRRRSGRRAPCRLTQSGTATGAISPTGRPRLSTTLGHERHEVAEDEDVGPPARRDRTEVVEAVVGRRVERRHHDRVLRGEAERDGVPDDRVDVPVVGDVLGLAVVGAEGHPVRARTRARAAASAARLRALEASRISSQSPARSRSRPSSTVAASWSDSIPAAA